MSFTDTNRLMDDCLQELEPYLSSRKSKFRGDIIRHSEFTLSRIVIHRGCYLIEYAFPETFTPDPTAEFIPDEHFLDRTGYECYENHVHTQDVLRSNKPGLHHLVSGIAIAEILKLKLQSSFPGINFRIIVGFPVKPLDLENVERPADVANRGISPGQEENRVRNDCTIRFHAVRAGEIIYDNLEAFRFDAMGIMEI